MSNPTHASAFAASRESFTCKAGAAAQSCKHRARIAFELAICEGRYLPSLAITGKAA